MRLRFLKAAHPQRDGRSNEQITQQAEWFTPPTAVRIGFVASEGDGSPHLQRIGKSNEPMPQNILKVSASTHLERLNLMSGFGPVNSWLEYRLASEFANRGSVHQCLLLASFS
jgi:hypothetical protein